MIVSYNGYTHTAKESNFRVSSEIVRTPGDYAYAVRRRIEQSGAIFGDSQSQLITNIEALIAAYSRDGGDYIVRFNDGTPTPDIQIYNDRCIGGVKVMSPPTMDPVNKSEYSSYWDYNISIEALEQLEHVKHNFIWDFAESLEYEGDGGPKTVLVPLKTGPAQRQQTRTHTICRLVQKGHLTLLNSRPGKSDIPLPRFPDKRVPEATRISKPYPKRINGSLMEWRLDYSYTFESATPFPDIEVNIMR